MGTYMELSKTRKLQLAIGILLLIPPATISGIICLAITFWMIRLDEVEEEEKQEEKEGRREIAEAVKKIRSDAKEYHGMDAAYPDVDYEFDDEEFRRNAGRWR